MSGLKFFVVKIEDIDNFIPLTRYEKDSLIEKNAEEERVKRELVNFSSVLKKYFHKKVVYTGNENKDKIHIENFLVTNGKITVILDPPCRINAEFLDKKTAEEFCEAIKETLEEIIPDNQIKELFISNIKVEEGAANQLTVELWETRHSIFSRKIISITTALIIIAGFLTFINNVLQAVISDELHWNSYFAQGIVGLVIGIVFYKLNKKIENWIERVEKRKIYYENED